MAAEIVRRAEIGRDFCSQTGQRPRHLEIESRHSKFDFEIFPYNHASMIDTIQYLLEGILHIPDDRQGDGQLRDPLHPLRPLRQGIVPRRMIRDLNLRPGLMLRGIPKGAALSTLQTIEGLDPGDYSDKITLYDSTALDPEPVIRLEHNPTEYTTRIIDMSGSRSDLGNGD